MEEKSVLPIDLRALAKHLLEDLRGAATSPARGEGLARLQEVAEQVRAARDRALDEHHAAYQARTEAMRQLVDERRRRLEAYARRERQGVPPQEGRAVVAGRVTDRATGAGLPNVRVRTADRERKHGELLSETRTDALGYFHLEYDPANGSDRAGPKPALFVEVLGDDGAALFTSSKPLAYEAGATAFVKATVAGEKVPSSLEAGRKISRSVDRRLDALAQRSRLLEQARAPKREPEPLRPPRTAPSPREAIETIQAALAQGAAPPPRKQAQRGTRRGKGPPPRQPSRRTPSEGRGAGPKQAARGKAAGSPGAPKRPGPGVGDIEGIGATFAARLEKAAIPDAAAVAALSPARLAEVLAIGEGRAEKILAAAKRLVKARKS